MKQIAGLKRINVELIKIVTHQIKTLRDSFKLLKRAIGTFHYPGHVLRLRKNDKYKQKKHIFAQKILQGNDVSAS